MSPQAAGSRAVSNAILDKPASYTCFAVWVRKVPLRFDDWFLTADERGNAGDRDRPSTRRRHELDGGQRRRGARGRRRVLPSSVRTVHVARPWRLCAVHRLARRSRRAPRRTRYRDRSGPGRRGSTRRGGSGIAVALSSPPGSLRRAEQRGNGEVARRSRQPRSCSTSECGSAGATIRSWSSFGTAPDRTTTSPSRAASICVTDATTTRAMRATARRSSSTNATATDRRGMTSSSRCVGRRSAISATPSASAGRIRRRSIIAIPCASRLRRLTHEPATRTRCHPAATTPPRRALTRCKSYGRTRPSGRPIRSRPTANAASRGHTSRRSAAPAVSSTWRISISGRGGPPTRSPKRCDVIQNCRSSPSCRATRIAAGARRARPTASVASTPPTSCAAPEATVSRLRPRKRRRNTDLRPREGLRRRRRAPRRRLRQPQPAFVDARLRDLVLGDRRGTRRARPRGSRRSRRRRTPPRARDAAAALARAPRARRRRRRGSRRPGRRLRGACPVRRPISTSGTATVATARGPPVVFAGTIPSASPSGPGGRRSCSIASCSTPTDDRATYVAATPYEMCGGRGGDSRAAGHQRRRQATWLAEREAFADREVDEEPEDARVVGIFGHDRAQHQWQIQSCPADELRGDHHRGEHRRRDETEQRPAGPVHDSNELRVDGPWRRARRARLGTTRGSWLRLRSSRVEPTSSMSMPTAASSCMRLVRTVECRCRCVRASCP